MERIMTLDEEDIIRLIARSVGVSIESVKLKMSADTTLSDETIDGEDEPVGMMDTTFKFYAKIELPITQIDGTPVKDADPSYANENDNDNDDGDGTEL